MHYSMAVRPSHNRVYTEQAVKLAMAELGSLNLALGGTMRHISPTTLGGADAITWEQDTEADAEELCWLQRLSCAYLCFRQEGEALFPLPLHRISPLQEDLVSIPKYTGRTNEQFTRLMVNCGLLASDFWQLPPERVLLLDPVCGRGTTLLEGLVQGHSVAGVETDKKDVEWLRQYMTRYLQERRWKHTLREENIPGPQGAIGRRYTLQMSPSKESFRDAPVHMDFVRGDTLQTGRYFKPDTFHLLAADLPYGVQHASSVGGQLANRPEDLLRDALPGWKRVLKPGGALAIAWNEKRCSRSRMELLVSQEGLEVCEPPEDGFSHIVDASITRDLLIAVKR